jgi:hypothetical protein
LDDNFKRKMVAYCGLIGAKDGLTPCEKNTFKKIKSYEI